MSNMKIEFMTEAIAEARKAAWFANGFPVGAVIAAGGEVISQAHNMTKKDGSHAEIEALNKVSDVDLQEAVLYTTLMPCKECLDEIISSGIETVVYGADLEFSTSLGVDDELYDVNEHPRIMFLQFLKDECEQILIDHDKDLVVNNVVSTENQRDLYWMRKALRLADEGSREHGEIPVAVIITKNDELFSSALTQTYTQNSPIAMGDYMALWRAQRDIYDEPGEMVMYSTLEPHLLGFGAAVKAHVSRVVYSMPAPNDGGAIFMDRAIASGEWLPFITKGMLTHEQYLLFKSFLERTDKDRVGYSYVNSLVNYYEKHYLEVTDEQL